MRYDEMVISLFQSIYLIEVSILMLVSTVALRHHHRISENGILDAIVRTISLGNKT
jgi:hypothetical protein